MTDTCTCAPDDCHGGHTINVGLPLTPAPFCGYGSCDRPPGHEGPHLCRCSKPVDGPANGCKWHTPGARLTDEQLRQLRDDPLADYHHAGITAMAAELLALRARVTELEAREAEARQHVDDQIAVRNHHIGRRRTAEHTIDALWRSRRDLQARITELEAEAQADERAIEESRGERDAARDRAAEAETEQQELIGFAVVSTAGQDDYLCLASDLLHRQADTAHGELIMSRAESPSTPWRVVELREVTE